MPAMVTTSLIGNHPVTPGTRKRNPAARRRHALTSSSGTPIAPSAAYQYASGQNHQRRPICRSTLMSADLATARPPVENVPVVVAVDRPDHLHDQALRREVAAADE